MTDKTVKADNLTSGGMLARNTIFNLVGQVAPMFVAVFTIPILIKGLGTDRLGVLTLVWTVIGYFSLFDMGLSRALTKLIAEMLGSGEKHEINTLIWTGQAMMLFLGIFGAIILLLISPWLVNDILKIPGELRTEMLPTFYLLSISIPVIISTAGLRGILEAYQRFDLVNVVRIPMGVYTFLGPVIVLFFSKNLFHVVIILVIGRLIFWFIHLWQCIKILPSLLRSFKVQKEFIKRLIRFGSWMTVTNVIGPVMVYMDRFIIGALVTVASVAYYTTPYEVVTKLWLIPGALVGVLFPAFATSIVQNKKSTMLLYNRGVKCIYLVLFPITLFIVTFAHEILKFWLGNEFAVHSTFVLQWLAVGVFMQSLAQIPYALIQGVGRPDLTAKLHLIELPIYLLIVFWLIKSYSIGGASMAWVIRAALDAFVLFRIVTLFTADNKPTMKSALAICGTVFPILVIFILPNALNIKILFFALMFSIFAFLTWFIFLTPGEKSYLKEPFKIYRTFIKTSG